MKRKVNVLLGVLLSAVACFSTLGITGCAEKVTVSFVTGTEESIPSVERSVGGTYGQLPTPEKENYRFKGWYTAKMNGERVDKRLKVTEETDHVLYAKWKFIGEREKVSYPLGVKENRLAANLTNSYYIDEEGNLFAWGRNSAGDVGDGTREDRYSPVQIMSGTKFAQVSSRYAIDVDGNLWGWGCYVFHYLNTEDGRMGSDIPVQILPEKKFYQVKSSGLRVHAIDQQGRLWAWGRNDYGTLGIGIAEYPTNAKIYSPTQVMKGTRFIDIETGHNTVAAIDEDGNLWIWGTNEYGQTGNGKTTDIEPTPINVMPGMRFIDVDVSSFCAFAIDESGNLWSWGRNKYGDLGDGTTEDRYEPIQITKGLSFSAVYTAGSYLAFDEYGGIWSWGRMKEYLWYDEEFLSVPTEIMKGTNVKQIASGVFHIMFINEEGELWSCGKNQWGQVGDGTKNERSRDNPIRLF